MVGLNPNIFISESLAQNNFIPEKDIDGFCALQIDALQILIFTKVLAMLLMAKRNLIVPHQKSETETNHQKKMQVKFKTTTTPLE
jgi:hypothetical protein